MTNVQFFYHRTSGLIFSINDRKLSSSHSIALQLESSSSLFIYLISKIVGLIFFN